MRAAQLGFTLIFSLLTAACGGGGESGGDGGVVTPPAPRNTLITNLVADQVFSGPAAASESEFDLAAGVTAASSGGDASNLTVSYDASRKSYTVAVAGRSQTFTPGDVISDAQGEVRYQKDGAAGRDSLTLVTTPYSGTSSNRYVGMGFWQRSSVTGQRQTDQFATFVYGLDTPASAMPRTGRAHFAIDVFGLATVPGYEPSVLQGDGRFDIDFRAGVFSTQSYLTETGLLSGDSSSGGGLELVGAGLLSSTEPAFSGHVRVGTRNADLSGSLTGRFYGPGAEELGASFSASNSNGATVVGSFTGQRGDAPPVNLVLTDVIAPQTLFAYGTALRVGTVDGRPETEVRSQRMIGQFHDRTNGIFNYGPGSSSMGGGDFTPAAIVSSDDPNFTRYETTFGDRDVRLDLYKVGEANSELALTYVSLGRWRSAETHGPQRTDQHHHFVYGLETPDRLLAARTGSARYEGVVYGAGANAESGGLFDIRGASVFNVDFSSQSYSGDLTLSGRGDSGVVDFGRYDFSGRLGWSRSSTAVITYNGEEVGSLRSRFYGPTGEEIGGDFFLIAPESVHAGQTTITGATVARRR